MSFLTMIHDSTSTTRHVPHITINDNRVHVKCGAEAPHPATAEHHIGEIKIYGMKGTVLVELGSARFYPGLTEALAEFAVIDIKSYSKIVATSYCNLHGIFHAEKEIK